MIPGLPNTGLINKLPGSTGVKLLSCLLSFLLLTACENDEKNLKAISAREVENPQERTTGVDMIFSDSAKVKVRLITPLLIQVTDGKHPHDEMPKGLKVISFDANLKQASQVVADYGIRRGDQKIIELRKNVVATNAKGETFKSDELIWDQEKKQFHSSKPVEVSFATGTHLYGVGFESDESMSHWKILKTTGQIPVNQNLEQ